MGPFRMIEHICTCHNCHHSLGVGYGTNVYSGGPFYCGNCHADVTIDVYGKGYRGYYVVSGSGEPVWYKWFKEAYDIANMFGAKLYYAVNYYYSPELVPDK